MEIYCRKTKLKVTDRNERRKELALKTNILVRFQLFIKKISHNKLMNSKP